MSSIVLRLVIYMLCLSIYSASAQDLIIDSLSYKNTYKKIRILGWNNDPDTSYQSILFMMDGQNLFDTNTSYSGEWRVDETLKNIEPKINILVIGIDHGNSERINELTPFENQKYGGGDADYLLEWIETVLMPHLSTNYKITVSEYPTAIAGSSLGGLFSHYALLERPDLFRYAGIFSPSYWYNDEIFTRTKSMKSDKQRRFYISGGTDEDESMIPNILKMKAILEVKANTLLDIHVVDDGKHNEAQWQQSFPLFITWLRSELSTDSKY